MLLLKDKNRYIKHKEIKEWNLQVKKCLLM